MVTDIPGLVVWVLVSGGCHNKLPQTGKLEFILSRDKKAEENRSGLGSHSPGGSGGEFFPLGASAGCRCPLPHLWPHLPTFCLRLQVAAFSVCLFFSECLIRTLLLDLEST